ncbi:SDR family NAD(P)-dependent oxidoreductase [Streptomyces sp. NPDC059697]|uniref:SDR family NAD(P)-dependent oxidoreductase n=1 Tax=Streptomyces sp. NPDC059697 TaxID=3346912 RepID=UPI0036CB8B38
MTLATGTERPYRSRTAAVSPRPPSSVAEPRHLASCQAASRPHGGRQDDRTTAGHSGAGDRASSGIGEATARSLVTEGAAVAVLGRRRERLRELAEKVRAEGGAAFVVVADITDQQQAAAAVESVVAELGRLDTVVNNAGFMGVGQAVDSPLEEWERMLEVNVQGLLYITHAALPAR